MAGRAGGSGGEGAPRFDPEAWRIWERAAAEGEGKRRREEKREVKKACKRPIRHCVVVY